MSRGELARVALMLFPGAMVVFLGFNAGGNFPGTTGIAALVLTQILFVTVVQARRPFDGLTAGGLLAILALALYSALTLASGAWSHSWGRALIEFDRAWLYLLVLLLFCSVRPRSRDFRRLVYGLLLGVSVVCLAGLISRVLPDVWHTAPDVANERLSYPVTYWNALGLLAALGIVLALHLTSTASERRAIRVAAAAVLPLLAAALFFTFSRGAILATGLGIAIYTAVGRPRNLGSAVLAAAPATAVLIGVAYRANLLDTTEPTVPAAVSQGHRVALAAALCALVSGSARLLLCSTLDGRRARAHPGSSESGPRRVGSPSAPRPILGGSARRAVAAGAVSLAMASVFALGVPHAVARDWHRFVSGASTSNPSGDLRGRLTDPSNNGRTDLWRAAVSGFVASPLHGSGAGTYQIVWDRRRPSFAYAVNAHSLYLQAMAELGLPGLLLILGLVCVAIVAIAVRARGAKRDLYAALLAVAAMWALHAGVDWDWEMPVLTLPFLAVAGLALGARKARAGSVWTPGYNARLALALALLATAIAPVVIVGSQSRLGDAEHALYTSNCSAAAPAALSSIGWLDLRPEPYEIVGFCDVERGQPRLGVTAMSQAVERDPRSWETYYVLAIARASAGIDPRSALAKAISLDPEEPLVRQAAARLRSSNPGEWVKRAAEVRSAGLASNDLSLVPS